MRRCCLLLLLAHGAAALTLPGTGAPCGTPTARCAPAAKPVGNYLRMSIDGDWDLLWFFPPNPSARRSRLREFSAELDVHRMSTGGPEQAMERFQQLSGQYQRALRLCETTDERLMLHRAWLSAGGVTAITTAAFSEPALAIAIAGSLGSVALLCAIIGLLLPDDRLPAATSPTGGGEAEGSEAEGTAATGGAEETSPHTLSQLHAHLHAAKARGADDEAAHLKAAIDALKLRAASAPAVYPRLLQSTLSSEQAAEQLSGAIESALQHVHVAAGEASGRMEAAEVEAALRAIEAAIGQPPMPAGLAAWGCDDETWLFAKNKKGLRGLLKAGDERRGRERIRRLRQLMEDEQSAA